MYNEFPVFNLYFFKQLCNHNIPFLKNEEVFGANFEA